jgi:hypothetical protein
MHPVREHSHHDGALCAYGRTGMYLSTRPSSPAVEDTTNAKRGNGREIIESYTSIGNLECNLI